MNKTLKIILTLLVVFIFCGCASLFCGDSDADDICHIILTKPDTLQYLVKDTAVMYSTSRLATELSDIIPYIKAHFAEKYHKTNCRELTANSFDKQERWESLRYIFHGSISTDSTANNSDTSYITIGLARKVGQKKWRLSTILTYKPNPNPLQGDGED